MLFAEAFGSDGGPALPGGREVPNAQLWHLTALAVLEDPETDTLVALTAALADLRIETDRELRALLRVTRASAAAAALRHVLGRPGPTGCPVGAEDVIDEIARTQHWLRADAEPD